MVRKIRGVVVTGSFPPATPEGRVKQEAIIKAGLDQLTSPNVQVFTGGGRILTMFERERIAKIERKRQADLKAQRVAEEKARQDKIKAQQQNNIQARIKAEQEIRQIQKDRLILQRASIRLVGITKEGEKKTSKRIITAGMIHTPSPPIKPVGFVKRKPKSKKGVSEKFPTTISATKPGDFVFLEPPLRKKIENFIINKIPGGSTIIRKLKDGSETLKDIGKRFPIFEDFLSEEEKKRRRLLEEGFVSELKTDFPGITTGTKTDVRRFREATFEEKLGVKKDKDSEKLKLQVDVIQDDFILGKLTEKEANDRFNLSLDDYLTKKAIQRIPTNIAIGLGLAAIQTIPVIGQVATASFIGLAILNRRNILGQFKNFPKASAINTASFIVGGLIGGVIKGSISGRFNKNIDPKNIKSVSGIVGKERIKAINQAQEIDSSLRIAIKQNKITGLSVYDILMKDGRLYRVVEFNKLTARDLAKGLSGEKGLIGFQLLKARGETFFGRGVSIVVNGKSQTFLRILRFKPAKSPIGKAIQKLGFNKGKIINILEKSKVVVQKGKITGILSEARILSIENINRSLGKLINQLEKKIKLGKKISLADFKKLINLERRANNLKPFTESEFKSASFPTLTQTLFTRIFNRAKIVFQKNNNLIKVSADVRFGVGGFGITKPGKITKILTKAKIKKTPLFKTFKEVSPSKFSTQLNSLVRKTKGSTKTQLKIISKQITNLKSRLTGSPGAVTLALATDLQKSIKLSVIPGAVVGVVIRSIWEGVGNVLSNDEFVFYSTIKKGRLTSEQRWIVSQLPKIKLRINLKLKTLQNLKQELKQKIKQISKTAQLLRQKLRQKLRQLLKQIQGLKQLQKIAQKLKQKLKGMGKGIGRPRLTIPKLPIPKKPPLIPIFIPKGFTKKTLKKKTNVWLVALKIKGKWMRLKARPFTLTSARDYMAYRLDTELARSGRLIPARKSKVVVGLPKTIRGYFQKIKHKLRPFKIKRGVRKALTREWIEKKKFIGDTKAEIRKLQIAKRLKPKKRKFKKLRLKKKIKKSNPKRLIKKKKFIKKHKRKKLIKKKSKKRKFRFKNKKLIKKKRFKLKPKKRIRKKLRLRKKIIKRSKSKKPIKKRVKKLKLKKKLKKRIKKIKRKSKSIKRKKKLTTIQKKKIRTRKIKKLKKRMKKLKKKKLIKKKVRKKRIKKIKRKSKSVKKKKRKKIKKKRFKKKKTKRKVKKHAKKIRKVRKKSKKKRS